MKKSLSQVYNNKNYFKNTTENSRVFFKFVEIFFHSHGPEDGIPALLSIFTMARK